MSGSGSSGAEMRVVRRLWKDVQGNLMYRETGLNDHSVEVRHTRTGVFVGCTFVTYDALDEIVKIANESPDNL